MSRTFIATTGVAQKRTEHSPHLRSVTSIFSEEVLKYISDVLNTEPSASPVGFDLPAGTFVRAANVSRAAHANDERGLHPL